MKDEERKIVSGLLENQFHVKEGECLVVSLDMLSDRELADKICVIAEEKGLFAVQLLIPAPDGVGMEVDHQIAGGCMVSALSEADIWIELNKKWIFGSKTYGKIMDRNPKLRHMNLTGASMELVEHCIGSIGNPGFVLFGKELAAMIKNAGSVRMLSKKGMDVSFQNVRGRTVTCELGNADRPGTFMLPGQIGWTPEIESVNGIIVLDGALAPVCGIPKEPVRITIKGGEVVSVEGGEEAKAYGAWLKSFHHPQMFRVSHTGLGINPGAVLSGDLLQDQRVFGSATWAFGSIGSNLVEEPVEAPSHSDCVALDITLYVDGKKVLEDGKVVDEKLRSLL